MEIYLLIGMMLFVFFQDIKMKALYWFLFPVILALCLWHSRETLSVEQVGYNLAILALLLLGLAAYLGVKHRRPVNPFGFFAWGDVLFLAAVIPLFNPHTFLFYFITGSCFVLLVHLTLSLLHKADKEIPFAGYMALYLGGMLLFADFTHIPLI